MSALSIVDDVTGCGGCENDEHCEMCDCCTPSDNADPYFGHTESEWLTFSGEDQGLIAYYSESDVFISPEYRQDVLVGWNFESDETSRTYLRPLLSDAALLWDTRK